MEFLKKEKLKSDIRTSLSVIRFITAEKEKALGKKNTRVIDAHIARVLGYMEELGEEFH